MTRRLLCLFCAAMLLFSVSSAGAAKKEPVAYSYDFDLTFSLNREAFPPLLRQRASGYADLLGMLGLKGNITWSSADAVDLNAELYYTDKPSQTYPFRLYGTKSHLFLTSPLLDNEALFFDMSGLLEFSAKAMSTLNIPLPYLAFLYPFTTEFSFRSLSRSWNTIIARPSKKTGTVTQEQFQALSEKWNGYVQDNPRLRRWITTVMSISDAPDTVEAEFYNLPRYYEIVIGGEPLSITRDKNSELWQDSTGKTLFSRRTEADSYSLALSLPASENGYIPSLNIRTLSDQQTASFQFTASVVKDPSFTPAASSGWDDESFPYTEDGEDFPYTEDGEDYPYTGDGEEYYEEAAEDAADGEAVEETYEDEYTEENEEGAAADASPDRLLYLHASGSGLPVSLPADSSFSVSATIMGAIYPDYAFLLQGSTKKDGTFSLSLCKPGSSENAPAEIFRVSGTLVPVEPDGVPSFPKSTWRKDAYGIFSMNDQTLAAFSRKVIPMAIRSLLSFVAEAPTSACQSLLDDLTELGVIGMLMN